MTCRCEMLCPSAEHLGAFRASCREMLDLECRQPSPLIATGIHIPHTLTSSMLMQYQDIHKQSASELVCVESV